MRQSGAARSFLVVLAAGVVILFAAVAWPLSVGGRVREGRGWGESEGGASNMVVETSESRTRTRTMKKKEEEEKEKEKEEKDERERSVGDIVRLSATSPTSTDPIAAAAQMKPPQEKGAHDSSGSASYPPLPDGYDVALREASRVILRRLVPAMKLPNRTLDSCRGTRNRGDTTMGDHDEHGEEDSRGWRAALRRDAGIPLLYPVAPWPVVGQTVDYANGTADKHLRAGLLGGGGGGGGGARLMTSSMKEEGGGPLERCTLSLRKPRVYMKGGAKGDDGVGPGGEDAWWVKREKEDIDIDSDGRGVGEEGGGGGEGGGPAKRAARRAMWVDDDPWIAFVGDSTARLEWKSVVSMYRSQGWRLAASSASKWKTPADMDMGKKGADPSKQSLQNRKRDQDAVLVRGSTAVVLSLRFVSGNQLTKLAATCVDFTINHDYLLETWPLPSLADADGPEGWDGRREATWASQPRSLLRGRVRAGRQPDVVVLNTGMWELPSVLKGRTFISTTRKTKNTAIRSMLQQTPKSNQNRWESEWDAFAAELYASRLPVAMRLFSPTSSRGGSTPVGDVDRRDRDGIVQGGNGVGTPDIGLLSGGGCGFNGRLVWRQTFDSNTKAKDNTAWTRRYNAYAACIAGSNGVPVLDAAAIHDAMGKPQKMLLTAKKPKVDPVHPSDETMLVTHVALFNVLCGHT